MYIYLTRHGETDWNVQRRTQGVQNIPLTDKGVRQAEELAIRLANQSITYIYSSILERAYHTATIIGKSKGIIPVKREELQEVNFGVWEGLTIKQIDEKFPGQLARYRTDFSFAPKNGEALCSLQQRIHCFIEFIKRGHADTDERVLIVSHAYPIRMLIIELMGLPHSHLWDFQLDNTGISIIQYQSRKSRIICLNDTCHLSRTRTKVNKGQA